MDNIRQLPGSLEVEIGLLGTIINNPECMDDVIGVIKADDFYNMQNKLIYTALEGLYTGSKEITLITLSEKLKKIGAEIKATYIANIVGSSFGNNTKQYVDILKEKSEKRKLIMLSQDLIKGAYDEKTDTHTLIETAENRLFAVINSQNNTKLLKFNQVLEETLDNLESLSKENGLTGIDSGFRVINRMTGGFQKGDFVIIAARPSMGKTVLGTNICVNASKDYTAAMFSLEMTKTQIMNRCLAAECSIDSMKFSNGQLNDNDWKVIGLKSGNLANKNLYIDDTGAMSVNEIKAKCKKLKLQHGLDLVVIDYLQLMSGKGENRQQEVTNISRGLKALAKELNICVICLSQLSRACEARSDHRPMLSDLRESGSIEQDADIVMFLYRDEYYNSDTEEKNVAECIFAKNRNGKVGTVKLAWLGQYQKFGTLDYSYVGQSEY